MMNSASPISQVDLPKIKRSRRSLSSLSAALVPLLAGIAISLPEVPVSAQLPDTSTQVSLDSREVMARMLTELRTALREPDVLDSGARTLTEKFIADVRNLPGGIAYLREPDALLSSLQQALKADADSRNAGLIPADATTLGPGSIPGVTGRILPDGRLRFILPSPSAAHAPVDQAITLDFVRVTLPGKSQPTWIGATEVSARQFDAIITAFGSWQEIAPIFPPFREEQDERLGPRIWSWRYERMPGVLPEVPVGLTQASHWLTRSRHPESTMIYPADLDPGQPTLDMPMQHCSPDAAAYAAALLSCRLPTVAEWTSACHLAHLAGIRQDQGLNLRDQTWQRQQLHAQKLAKGGRRILNADAGSFIPVPAPTDSKAATITADKAADVVKTDDRTLWFSPVTLGGLSTSPDAPTLLQHIIGNVAELVWADQPATLPPNPAAIRSSLDAQAGNLRIIGSSALSSPTIPPDRAEPIVLGEAREGYADVGFRLAFSGEPDMPATLAQRLLAILDNYPNLTSAP